MLLFFRWVRVKVVYINGDGSLSACFLPEGGSDLSVAVDHASAGERRYADRYFNAA